MIDLKFSTPLIQIATLLFFCLSNLYSQENDENKLAEPIHGNIVLIGSEEPSINDQLAFTQLAINNNSLLLRIKPYQGKFTDLPLLKEKFANVKTIELKENQELTKNQIQKLKLANAVWLDGDFNDYKAFEILKLQLKNLLKRNGVFGAHGVYAEQLGTVYMKNNNAVNGFDVIHKSYICTNEKKQIFDKISDKFIGKIAWHIPNNATVVLHDERKIAVLGSARTTLKVPAQDNWPERIKILEPTIPLPYSTDLISWKRSVIQRQKDLFPPKVAPVPKVDNGALLIIGGSGYPEDMWERVVKHVGGADASFVCISQSEDSYGAKKLKELGCKNITVFHTKNGLDGIGQGNDKILIEAIKNADALYFGGGRTYRFMDAYLNTKAHVEMNNLLARGGLILGTSAGAQIQGDFLVRGDPRTNKTLWMEGNDEGLGFIKGVIIDAHFRQRNRQTTLPKLLVKHPQMLGIGIDEATAIFVEGSIAEVWGKNAVTFYDLEAQSANDTPFLEIGKPVILKSGEKYDFENRKKIN